MSYLEKSFLKIILHSMDKSQLLWLGDSQD